jgi:Ca2+-binding RTX toxin-like protein
MATVYGSNVGETINAADGVTNGADTIYGFGGNDLIFGLGGHDMIKGGGGADTIDGGAGSDFVNYTDSAEGVWVNLNSGQGFGGTAEGDTIANVEHVIGSYYDDSLTGDGGENLLYGLDGHDSLIGGAGDDRLYGDHGNDVLRGDEGADALYGGDGIDTANYAFSGAAVIVDLGTGETLGGDAVGDSLHSIENVNGSNFNDALVGDGGGNVLSGRSGNDYVAGFGGNDVLYGGNGTDVLDGGMGADLLNGGDGADTFQWMSTAESGLDAASVDVVTGFDFAEGDIIHLSYIDANTELDGDQAFTFIGAADYTGAGQIRVVDDGVNTFLAFSTDSDPDNDGAIRIDGLVMPAADWFVL